MSHPSRTFLVVCIAAVALGAAAHPSAAEPALQATVDRLRLRLGIQQDVRVLVVPENALAVSVEPTDDNATAFRLAVDATFLDQLAPAELEAAVAHELGHVWIFTHHPYLQTEALANDIALQLVSRDTLVRVYDKVWKRTGTKGSLPRFVGD